MSRTHAVSYGPMHAVRTAQIDLYLQRFFFFFFNFLFFLFFLFFYFFIFFIFYYFFFLKRVGRFHEKEVRTCTHFR